MRYKTFHKFKLVIDTEYSEIACLHPLMQRPAEKLCCLFANEPDFVLGIFGSAITWKCNSFSDLDIVIRFFIDTRMERFYDVSKRISLAKIGVPTDVIFYNDLAKNERLYEEIHENAYPLIISPDAIQSLSALSDLHYQK